MGHNGRDVIQLLIDDHREVEEAGSRSCRTLATTSDAA